MTLRAELREQVRQRAHFACEYCGVTETDSGGELTVDHFRPKTHGGTDDLENLLYCCSRCNLYKADYWPCQPNDPVLWNPRQNPAEVHLLTLADGKLFPLTAPGEFALKRLRLNRSPLLVHRRRKQVQAEELRLLARYREIVTLLKQLHQQQVVLLEEHRALLEEQRTLLRLLLRKKE